MGAIFARIRDSLFFWKFSMKPTKAEKRMSIKQ